MKRSGSWRAKLKESGSAKKTKAGKTGPAPAQIRLVEPAHKSSSRLRQFRALSFKHISITKFIRSKFLPHQPPKKSLDSINIETTPYPNNVLLPPSTLGQDIYRSERGFNLDDSYEAKALVRRPHQPAAVPYRLRNLPNIFENVTFYLLNHPTYGVYVASLYIEIDLLKHGISRSSLTDEMGTRFTRILKGQVLGEDQDQPISFSFDGQRIKAIIRNLIVQQELLQLDDALGAVLVALAEEMRTMAGTAITVKTRGLIEDSPKPSNTPSTDSIAGGPSPFIQLEGSYDFLDEQFKEGYKPQGGHKELLVEHLDEHFDKQPRLSAETRAWNLAEDPDLEAQVDSIPALVFNPERYGIGGLDKEFHELFHRALSSRLYRQTLLNKIGIEHVKGIILYGPPGTGKTLVARKLAKCLGATVEVINGPELFDRYLGGAEQELRKLFERAEQAKQDCELHVIIFDEIDAICKRRGNETGGVGRVGDNIVNQLLAKMDGIEQIHNILLIGLTNRLDTIDEALLRPGRFEIQLEFRMPDAGGREQILKAHVCKLLLNNALSEDVDLALLAERTRNFSGADLASLVRCATFKALSRQLPPISQSNTHSDQQDIRELEVTMRDFQEAIEQVRPAHKPSFEELEQAIPHGILLFDHPVKKLLRKGELCVKQVYNSEKARPVSVLLHGLPETGKTALAATIARQSNFPYIRLISPDNVTNLGQHQQVAAITKVFEDCYKYPLSVVIVDDIEYFFDWDPMRQTYSMTALRAISALLKRPPPKGHGLLIIATSSIRPVLGKLRILKLFDLQLHVLPITTWNAFQEVLTEVKFFEGDTGSCLEIIQNRISPSSEQNPAKMPAIGIKRLLRIIDLAKQESKYDEVIERLIEELLENVENRLIQN